MTGPQGVLMKKASSNAKAARVRKRAPPSHTITTRESDRTHRAEIGVGAAHVDPEYGHVCTVVVAIDVVPRRGQRSARSKNSSEIERGNGRVRGERFRGHVASDDDRTEADRDGREGEEGSR